MSSVLSADSVFFSCPQTSGVNANASPQPVALSTVWFGSVDEIGSAAYTYVPTKRPPPRRNYIGVDQEAVNSFLYGRIYIDPSLLSLGNLVSSQTRQFHVWNATFGAVDVTNLVSSNDAGLMISQPEAIPYSLGPLQEIFYTLSISLDGPAQVDAVYVLTVAGIDYTVEVIGSRVVIFPFMPDWSQPVKETLEFMTDVMKCYGGSEQRVSLRPKARRRLAYDFLLLKTLTQFFDNILWGWQNRAFAVPLWQYVCKSTADVPPGSLIVPVDTTTAGFLAGQTMGLYKDPATYEVIEIASVTDTALTLTNVTGINWPAGSSVYPVGISVIEANIPVTRHSSRALNGTVSFMMSPLLTDPFIPALAATDVYNGVEVIMQQPDWSAPIDMAASFGFDTVDFLTGSRDYAITDTYQSLVFKFRWVLTSRVKVNAFRALLGRLKGQLNPVYIPSWNEDFTLSADISQSDVGIAIIDRNFFQLVGANPARGNLMIRSRKHGIFFRPIQSVGITGNVTLIGIGSPLGVGVPMSDIISISYLSLYRKSADNTLIQWQSGEVAIVEDAFQLVPA